MASVGKDNDEFLTQIESTRTELRDKFSKVYNLLKEKEEGLLIQLKEIEDSYLRENKRLSDEKKELLGTKEHLQTNIRRNRNQTTLQEMLSPLEDKLRKLENERDDDMQRIELIWEREGELESILEVLCSIRLSKVMDYNKSTPVLFGCKYRQNSVEPGEFNYPTAVKIHPRTNNMYVCDEARSRIQVFNMHCEFLFSFSENMNFPAGICFYNDKVYVTQFLGHKINVYSVKSNFITSVGRWGNKESQFDSPLGIDISESRKKLYICDRNNNRVQILNTDLSFNAFITGFRWPIDLRVVKEEIFILDRRNPCLHVYDHERKLIREFISFGYFSYQVSNTSHLCIDFRSNILMTDRTACCVLVFSRDGKLVQKFGNKGDNAGEFQSPRGIAIDSEGRIVVVSSNPNHCIQFF
ncbi:Zinc finger, C3HC4 type [Oopsacas minuta]|uniref:Zinc finger, C3HC4 type n=1 Tax=Oopsacas minuta TaxID=111878 RepID=A0AAV7K8K5_9METZ|nr:Zinc finger, C3HC4 type [Oopsacas minuta]